MSDQVIQVRDRIEREKYVQVSFGLLYTTLLSTEEKLCFIALRSFIGFGEDTGKVWPTMDTVCTITRMGRSRATRAINGLVKKGLVTKKRQGLNKPNIYTLSDSPYVWESRTEQELQERAAQILPYSDKELQDELIRRGYTVTKENGPTSETGESTGVSPKETKSYTKDTNKSKKKQAKKSGNNFEQREHDDGYYNDLTRQLLGGKEETK